MGRGSRRSARQRDREAHAIAGELGWREGRAAHDEGRISDAELGCIYIAERVHRRVGGRFLQAERRPTLASSSASRFVRLFAERELCGVPSPVPRALVAWADGARPVDLLFHVPSPRDILAAQARGRRVVSLLDDGIPTAPHEDGLAFAIHDLCHLEKFMDPAHHVEQVGFFALLDRGIEAVPFRALESTLDTIWVADRDHVIADMNGAAAFLYLTLKNKLKLAVRRRLSRARGVPCPGGPLDPAEVEACDAAYEALFDLLELSGATRDAARALSRKLSGEAAAALLSAHFAALGEAELAGRAHPSAG